MRRLWIVIVVLVLTVALISVAKKKAEQQMLEERLDTMDERAVSLLEERYGEDFVCVEVHTVVGMYGGVLYYAATCAPASDESLKFRVVLEMGKDGNYYITDEYYAAQTANCELSREVSKEFTSLWGNYRAECGIVEHIDARNSNDETTIQAMKDGKLDWQFFLRHCGILYNDASDGYYKIELHILVDESSTKCSPGEEYDTIVRAVEKYREIVSSPDVRFFVYVYATPGDLYGKCVDILNSYTWPYIMARHSDIYGIIKDDGRGHSASMNEVYVSNGERWSLDKQGYIEKRTAVCE